MVGQLCWKFLRPGKSVAPTTLRIRSIELLRLLSDLEKDFAASAQPEARKLEQSLSGVERMISEGVRAVAGAEHVATVEREVKEQLKPYRKHMELAVYQQTLENLLLKRLREQFGIPRLSLFYL